MGDIRAPDDIKELAYKDYMDFMKYKDISEKYTISIDTVKSWVKRYGWAKERKGAHKNEKGCTQKDGIKDTKSSKKAKVNNYKDKPPDKVTSTQKTNTLHFNARPGNKSAVGYGAPARNKNAITTGEFESIFFDTLDDDELELIDRTPFEKMELLKQEIQLLTVRQRRMLKRIAELRDKEVILDSETHGTQGDGEISISNYDSALNKIQNIEEALTRIQDKKQKAIDSLHKYEMDELKANIEKEKLELEKYKTLGDEESDNNEAIQRFLKATSMSEEDVKALFEDEGDEDGHT